MSQVEVVEVNDEDFQDDPTIVEELNELLQGIKKPTDYSIDEMALLFVRIRAYKSRQAKIFKQIEENANQGHELLSMRFRELAEQLGLESLPTKYGTAYKLKKTYYRVKDWSQILDFILRTDNFQMLEKRIGKNATAEIHQSTGELPPGVEYSEELTFTVRKK